MNGTGSRGGYTLPFALLLLLAPAVPPVLAQAIIINRDIKWTYLLVVSTDKDRIIPTFKMKPGACLVGPLEFIDVTGKPVFTLGDQVEYPTGCRGTNK